MHTCNHCLEQKKREEFYPRRFAKSGIGNTCRECVKAQTRQWNKDNPKRRKAR